MPCHTRTNPLQTIQPPHKNVAHLTTPVKKSAKRSKRSDRTQHLDLAPRDDNDGVEPTSIHSVPTELLSAVLSLSEDTCENDVEAQRQRFTNAAVCKAWKLLTVGPGASDEFAIRGFKTARRCMRVFSSSEPETSKRADEARRVSVDLMRDERVGTNQMVADLISACDNLRELTLLFLVSTFPSAGGRAANLFCSTNHRGVTGAAPTPRASRCRSTTRSPAVLTSSSSNSTSAVCGPR